MRNRPFSVITWKKQEEPKQYLHCKFHVGQRLLDNGFCPECGPTIPATKTIYTTIPSQSTQGLSKKK